jgi:hypothetical protein
VLEVFRVAPEIPFKLEFPIEVWKKSGEAGKERRIGGIISSEHTDRQDEVVLQRGLEWDSFLRSGWINDNHSRDTTGIVGYPIKVRQTIFRGKPATYMEGYLLPDYDKADEIWKLANSLQKTNRRLGFSIEGKVKQRIGPSGKTVAKAHVSNVAVTNCPVNTITGLEVIAKSISALEQMPDPVEKAMTAGQSVGPPVAPVAGDGFALRTESLEGSPKNTAGKKRKRKKKTLSKAEALGAIKERYPGIDDRAAERIWLYAKTQGA